jgi:hypothetical protein
MQDHSDLARQGDLRPFRTSPLGEVYLGTMSARIVMHSARTMAGAHITEATPPTKMRLRVSIEPPNVNVSEMTLQLSEGKCPITRPNACYS